MIEWWDYYVWGYEAPQSTSGTATTLPVEPEDDAIERLHKAVEDVTGRPVEMPPKTRIGFV